MVISQSQLARHDLSTFGFVNFETLVSLRRFIRELDEEQLPFYLDLRDEMKLN